jgi:uncharacterized glyoxalase superfamily protein PhnB
MTDQLVIPAGYQRVMPYLIIDDADAFLDFTKRIFGATEKLISRRENTRIMHGELQIGDSTIMFSESTPEYSRQNASLYVYVPDADVAYINALAAGATSIMEMSDQPYGRTGGITDPSGNSWWIVSAK